MYNYWAIELCKHLKWESILDIVNPIRDYLGKEVQAGTPDKESDSMIDRYLANQEERHTKLTKCLIYISLSIHCT